MPDRPALGSLHDEPLHVRHRQQAVASATKLAEHLLRVRITCVLVEHTRVVERIRGLAGVGAPITEIWRAAYGVVGTTDGVG